MRIAFRFVSAPSSAVSNITQAPCTKLKSPSTPRRQRPPCALRLGRRRRALRRPRLALHGPTGAGDGLLHWSVAPDGGVTMIGKLGAKPPAGPVLVTVFGADSVRTCQKLAAALRNAGIRAETVSRQPQARHRPAAQICRQARLALRGDPGARRKSQGRSADPRPDRGLGAERHQGSRRIFEETGGGAVRNRRDKLVDAVRDLLKRHGLA